MEKYRKRVKKASLLSIGEVVWRILRVLKYKS